MASPMFGRSGAALCAEVVQHADDPGLPPFNAELVRRVHAECQEHAAHMLGTYDSVIQEHGDWDAAKAADAEGAAAKEAAIFVHQSSILRNKVRTLRPAARANGPNEACASAPALTRAPRAPATPQRCLLAYQHARTKRLLDLRHQLGPALPPDVTQSLSRAEREFVAAHSKHLREYFRATGIDLSTHHTPPNESFVDVLCLQEGGEVYTVEGVKQLEKGTYHRLTRSVAEPLIAQGVLQENDVC